MVQSHQVQQRGVQVVNVDLILDGVPAELIGGAVDQAALEHHRRTPHFKEYATALYQIMRSRAIENLNAVD